MDNNVKHVKQILLIEDRKKIELNDVESILSFEDDYITLMTSYGRLIIEGSGLRVIDLSKDNGRISLIGVVSSVTYEDEGKRKKGGLFGK